MAEFGQVSLVAAFMAGVVSFISPCILPLVPSYISFITGLTLEELTESRGKTNNLLLKNSLLFILGFSVIFILLGASSSFLGRALLKHQSIIKKIGGLLIIGFGFYLTGLLRSSFLSIEKRFHLGEKPAGFLGSFFVGCLFAFGWSPCIGPILGAILVYASTEGEVGKGILLLSSYSLGLALPFFLVSLGMNTFLTHSKKIYKYIGPISKVCGVFLIVIGLLLFFGYFEMISYYLLSLFSKS